MPAEANNLPDSEAVPSHLPEVTPILRVAHSIHPTHPRIAYLCVRGALEEAIIAASFGFQVDIFKFKATLLYWIETNDEILGNGKVRPSDVRDMQSFYLEYYEKNIQALFRFLEDNRYFEGYGPGPMPLWPTPTEGLQPSETLSVRSDRCQLLTYACRVALALYKVVENISKDVQLPPQMRAVEAALGVRVYSRDNSVRNKTQPLPTPPEVCPPKGQGHNKSENIITAGNKPVGTPGWIGVSLWIQMIGAIIIFVLSFIFLHSFVGNSLK